MIARNIAQPIDATLEQASSALLEVAVAANDKAKCISIKSPLRYPGGKTRATKQILELLPPDLDRLCSPFAGGASVELACAAKGIDVFAYDAFDPLVNFWKVLINDAPKLAKMVSKYYPLSKTKFYALQKRYFNIKNSGDLAAAFFALNRSSFSGTTLSGGMSPGHPRFTENAIDRLASFRADHFRVEKSDFTESIPRHKNDFLYLDPPYANGGKLYGIGGSCHADFNHKRLAEILKKRNGWLLSYNDCGVVRDLYKGFKILIPEWAYGMNNSRKSNEVLILSKDYICVS